MSKDAMLAIVWAGAGIVIPLGVILGVVMLGKWRNSPRVTDRSIQ
jgi:hypothetical protein